MRRANRRSRPTMREIIHRTVDPSIAITGDQDEAHPGKRGIVIRMKDIWLLIGLPSAAALILSAAAFFAVMIYLGWRLRWMYFG